MADLPPRLAGPWVQVLMAPAGTIHRLVSWLPAPAAVGDLPGWPLKPGTSSTLSGGRILCLGPGEWLISGTDLPSPAPEQRALIDMSHAFARIVITGAAEELLSLVCALDLRLAQFPVESCTRTRFAGVPAVLERTAATSFRCYLSQSSVRYVMTALREAARSFQ